MADLHRLSALWKEFEICSARAPSEHEQLIVAMKLLAQVMWLAVPSGTICDEAISLGAHDAALPGFQPESNEHALPAAPGWSIKPQVEC